MVFCITSVTVIILALMMMVLLIHGIVEIVIKCSGDFVYVYNKHQQSNTSNTLLVVVIIGISCVIMIVVADGIILNAIHIVVM